MYIFIYIDPAPHTQNSLSTYHCDVHDCLELESSFTSEELILEIAF